MGNWRKLGLVSGIKSAIVPAGQKPRSILTGPFRGIRMGLDLQRESQLYAGLYEREVFSSIRKLSKGIRTMVDIGAAHGEYTLYGLMKTKAERVISFEPDPEMIGNLTRNLKLNGMEQDTRLQFHQKYLGDGKGPDWISADRLGDWIEPPCFLKMDIEGHEVDVLRAAAATKLLTVPGMRWLIETHSAALRRECQEMLASAGYEVRYIPQAWWRAVLPELRGLEVGWLIATRK